MRRRGMWYASGRPHSGTGGDQIDGTEGRTKVRILAMFANLKGCKEHHKVIWDSLRDFAKAAAADALRVLMGRAPSSYTEKEAEDLKTLILGVIAKWNKLPIVAGTWTHRAVHTLKETLVRYALSIGDKVQVPTTQLSTAATLDSENWPLDYAELVAENEKVVERMVDEEGGRRGGSAPGADQEGGGWGRTADGGREEMEAHNIGGTGRTSD